MKNKKIYNIIATIKPWNVNFFAKNIDKLKGNWILITSPLQLSISKLKKININNIYFIHWSEIVSRNIYEKYNCISFHMTNLPYGRGGSPLQNLILRGKKSTKISAFRMGAKIDAGPIYLKKKLNLNGSAEEIFIRSTKITFKMIIEINKNRLSPKTQKKSKIFFRRLTKKDNNLVLDKIKNLKELYDRIRMVDAPGYPDAYIESKRFIFNFTKAKKVGKNLYSSVRIIVKKN